MKNKLKFQTKEENGITLVALVVTIIVLLILAGVSINLVAGSNGIMGKAVKSVAVTKEAQKEEEIQLKLAEIMMDYYVEGRGQTLQEYIIEKCKENEGDILNVGNGMFSTIDGDLYYTDAEGNTSVIAIDNNGNVTIEGSVSADGSIKDEKAPAISVTTTTNSITFVAKDIISGVAGWNYSETNEEPTTWNEVSPSQKSFSYTIENLISNTTYYIWAKDANGNVSQGKIAKTIDVQELTEADIEFEYSTKDWTNQSVTVTVKPKVSMTGYTMQISTDKEHWEDGDTYTFSDNGKLYVVLRDSTGQQGKSSATASINNIDKINPTIPEAVITAGTAGKNSWYTSNITVGVTEGSDNESGVQKTIYTLSGATSKAETEIMSGQTIEISNQGITTVTVYTLDNVGNKSQDKILTVKKDTSNPTINLSQANTTTKEYNKTINANISDDVSGISVRKYAPGNRDVNWMRSNGTNMSTNFVANMQAYYNSLSGDGLYFDFSSNPVYTVYAENGAGLGSIQTISISQLLIQVSFVPNHGIIVSGGTISNGSVTCPNGCLLWGPYAILPAGTYKIRWERT